MRLGLPSLQRELTLRASVSMALCALHFGRALRDRHRAWLATRQQELDKSATLGHADDGSFTDCADFL